MRLPENVVKNMLEDVLNLSMSLQEFSDPEEEKAFQAATKEAKEKGIAHDMDMRFAAYDDGDLAPKDCPMCLFMDAKQEEFNASRVVN
jgi:hypothetical protein